MADYYWPAWNQTFYTNSTTTSANITVDRTWTSWTITTTAQTLRFVSALPEDAAAKAARLERERAAFAEATARYEAEARKRAKEAAAAKTRALRLLKRHLTKEQADELQRLSRFTVIGADGETYRVRRGWSGNIDLVRDEADGKYLIEQYCIHFRERVPEEDLMLAQKFMLETDPAALKAKANVTRWRQRLRDEEAEAAA